MMMTYAGNVAIMKDRKVLARTTQAALVRTALPETFINCRDARRSDGQYVQEAMCLSARSSAVVGHVDGLCTIQLTFIALLPRLYSHLIPSTYHVHICLLLQTDYLVAYNIVDTIRPDEADARNLSAHNFISNQQRPRDCDKSIICSCSLCAPCTHSLATAIWHINEHYPHHVDAVTELL